MKSLLSLIVVTLGVFISSSSATICKPRSQFKVDCNTCYCSDDGKEYSCTKLICSVSNPFLIDDDEDGYVLKPKFQPRNVPYLNDEIPISNEEWENEFSDGQKIYQNDIIPMGSDDDIENFEDVSLGEQDVELMNEDLPDYFRFKRNNLK